MGCCSDDIFSPSLGKDYQVHYAVSMLSLSQYMRSTSYIK